MSDVKKLLIITSGGDAPGMNAAIRGIVRTALHVNIQCMGAKFGYKGIFENNIFALNSHSVANIVQRGGTILKSTRFPEFKNPEIRKQAAEIIYQHKIDALVVLGGDGSFRGAKLLEQEAGLKVIGIPCTIDNDISGTDYSIGFDTARNTALEAIDRIRDTAFSHNRNFLVEVMGRDTGFLAVDVGIAGGAEFILIPEMSIDTAKLVQRLSERNAKKMGSIIVVAEGPNPGRSFAIADEIKSQLDLEYRVCVLGHTQRGGTPSLLDRKRALLMGAKAVLALKEGISGKMLAIKADEMVLTEFPDPSSNARRFADMELMKINELLCNV
jgi:6-phosphofructokinase 1